MTFEMNQCKTSFKSHLDFRINTACICISLVSNNNNNNNFIYSR